MTATFDILSTESGLDLQLAIVSQSSTGKTYETGTKKAIFRWMALYNKYLYSQCSLTAQKEQVQGKK